MKTEKPILISSDKETANIFRSSGKARNYTDFPLLEIFLNDADSYPLVKSYEMELNHVELVSDLILNGAEEIFVKEKAHLNDNGSIQMIIERAVYKLDRGYYISLESAFYDMTSFGEDLSTNLKNLSPRANLAMIATIDLLCPSIHNSLKNLSIEEYVKELAEKHSLRKESSKPYVGMICKDRNFYIKDFYITKNYNLINPDLHYGEGFEEFHHALLHRFKNDPKGLVLFHGEPGTGKTFYIRNLIKDLLAIGKQVIYFPPNMVNHLVSPEIMTFLSSIVLDMAEEGKSCVLLLEDAEPLLVSRTEGRSDGITNLLNITDGLLNDMLSIQVIATFNTELKNIDEALLRPERLIARKEFNKLKPSDAEILANSIGLNKKFDADVTLAEIYSQYNANEVLTHEYSAVEKRRIGF